MNDHESLKVQAIVDLLGRRQPELLSQIRSSHPTYSGILQPGKVLGSECPAKNHLLVDLVVATIGLAKKECTDTYQLVSNRLRVSSRLRLGSGIVSSTSSGGLITALMQGASEVALVAGVLTFLASGFILVAQYLEDYSGGDGSLKTMRDRVVDSISEAAEIEGEVRIMELRNDFVEVEPLVRKLNSLIASVRQVQLKVR